MTRPLVDYVKTNVGQVEVGGIVTRRGHPDRDGQDVSVTATRRVLAMVTLPSEGLIDVVLEAMDRRATARRTPSR